MSMKDGFKSMVEQLASSFEIPDITDVYFPEFRPGGQPKYDAFMAVFLQGGASGVSCVLVPDELKQSYGKLKPADFVGNNPAAWARHFGSDDPVTSMVSLACLNALCRHVITESGFPMDFETDSLGLLSAGRGDTVGMVGLFPQLVGRITQAGARLVVIEKKEQLVEHFTDATITLDPTALRDCNKVLCTSTTLLNNTIDEILGCCSKGAHISIVGPTAGFFPDPLFRRGVEVVGGTFVHDGALFYRLIRQGERWGPATRKFCFRKDRYQGAPVRRAVAP